MKMFTRLSFVVLVTVSSLRCAAADSDSLDYDLKLKPALLYGGDNDFAAAAKYRAKLRYDLRPWSSRASGFALGKSEGTLATRARIHSENIFAEVHLGGAYQLQTDYTVPPPPPPGTMDPNAPPTVPPPTGGFRYGLVELSFKGRFETDQPLENYAATFGPQLGYFHNNTANAWALVPSLFVDYQQVEVLKSRYYDSLGVDEDTFFRLSAVASWDVSIGELLSEHRYVTPLAAVFNLRYSYAYNVPDAVKDQGKDQAWYWEAGLNYEFTDIGWKWLRNAYVTVARGRQPPVVENETMVFVGLVVGWDKTKRR